MPSLVTHQLFAYEALHRSGDERLLAIVNRYPEAFSIGSSGPDIFLFYHFWPFGVSEKAKSINELGNLLHQSHINDVFTRALNGIKESSSSCEEAISYVTGWMCHYALDRIAHPFIFYWSGFGSTQSNYHHRRMEAMIDALMIRQKLGRDIKTIRPFDVVRRGPLTHTVIYEVLAPVVRSVFQFDLQEGDILRCLQDMRLLYVLLHDPHGWKFEVLHRLEPMPYAFTGTLIKRKFNDHDESFDVLNKSHKTWVHPCDDTFVSQDSFLNVYETALQEASLMVQYISSYLFEDKKLDQLMDMIGNRTYDTGMLNTVKMKHSRSKYWHIME